MSREIKIGEKHIIEFDVNNLNYLTESREKLLSESKLVNRDEIKEDKFETILNNQKSDK